MKRTSLIWTSAPGSALESKNVHKSRKLTFDVDYHISQRGYGDFAFTVDTRLNGKVSTRLDYPSLEEAKLACEAHWAGLNA